MMRGVAFAILCVSVARAEEDYNLADEFLTRALKLSPGVQVFEQADFDGTALGKAGNLVTPARTSLTQFAPPSSAVTGPLRQRPATVGAGRHVAVYAATVDAKTVKQLRDATGAGMMACKKALAENDGDLEKAMDFLRKKGIAAAEKRSGRGTSEGIVEAYIHAGSKLGVMVELNCETDFVAKNPEFKDLARSVAMQVAASPTVVAVTEADIDQEFLKKEKEILSGAEDMKGKPDNIIEKIVEGRIAKIVKEKALMDQPYIKDPSMSISDLVKSYSSKFGENIKVGRFSRFTVGGD
jgi:elongation factor Ts